MNIIDKLVEKIISTKNPTVIGLDPDILNIPKCYKTPKEDLNAFEAVAEIIFDYNKDIIDTVCDIVPAVKPQTAFYEKYGSFGIKALEKTISYAKKQGLIVIEDAKRNDIGNTAKAYADAHLGLVDTLDGCVPSLINADFLTVTPFLGSDSIAPFIDTCIKNNKGVFILVKTSNKCSVEIQDAVNGEGFKVSEYLANCVSDLSKASIGEHGYSPICAVVGATFPNDAFKLRNIMKTNYFLVPGYGVQGGNARDVMPCFDNKGLGAIINSSRGILYGCMTDIERNHCSKSEYLSSVRHATLKMRDDIYKKLKCTYKDLAY